MRDDPATPYTTTLLAGAVLLQVAGPAWAIAGGISLFIAGLPHGAFAGDGRFLIAEPRYVLRYLLAGAVVAAAFLAVPVAALGVFLGLSAWHFLHEPAAGRWLRRGAIAALAVGASALIRAGETQAVFSALCGSPVPAALMNALAAVGIAGYVLAALALARKPGDLALWVMIASPVLFHPVLATGLIFMLGHAGPVTAAIMQQAGRGWQLGLALGGSSVLLAAMVVLVLPPPLGWVPWFAAGALAVVVPHLLPSRWMARGPASDLPPRQATDHKTQAATSPAT